MHDGLAFRCLVIAESPFTGFKIFFIYFFNSDSIRITKQLMPEDPFVQTAILQKKLGVSRPVLKPVKGDSAITK